jgi:DNA invertase Pin-like site-specific DNA recombinase
VAAVTRAALYARVSTSTHGQDVEVQLVELRRVAAQRGWTVVDEYRDEGVSGARDHRPALDRMMNDARRGLLDVVLVARLDRLGRSLLHLVRLLDELQAVGVGFASVGDPGLDTTTPTGRLLMQVTGAFAEYERALIRERVRAGVAHARAKGVKLGRPEVEVPLARARALLADGHPLAEVARRLGLDRRTLRRRLGDSPLRAVVGGNAR